MARFANRLLSYISAAYCGVILFVLGTAIIGVSRNLLHKIMVDPVSGAESAGAFIGRLLGFLLMLAIGFACGVAFGRFLLRAMPPRITDPARRDLVMGLFMNHYEFGRLL